MKFYINTNTHEVHKHFCKHVNNPNLIELGSFNCPSEAVTAAKSKGYGRADTCYHCCESHNPDKFYINENTHEVHRYYCYTTDFPHVIELGTYYYPSIAITAAKLKGYNKADGCAHCCSQSHNN